MLKVYIGIDGGGTKTAFLLIDSKGNRLGEIKSTTIHVKQESHENIRSIIFDSVNSLLDQAGKTIEDLGYLFAGVPAYGEFLETEEVFDSIFEDLVGSGRFNYNNDAVAGWAGSQMAKPGVNMVLGTGAIAFGIDYKGNQARSSGWGPYCGDQGSAYWLGRQAIALFGRQADGRAQKSALYHIIKEEFSLEKDLDFISKILALKDNRTEIAKLSKLLSRAAQEGDEEAIKIIKLASQEVIESIRAVIKNLDFEDDEIINISYSGGVFNIGSLLTDPIEDELLKDKRIVKIDSILEPIEGAALMALKYGGIEITDEIVENLKG